MYGEEGRRLWRESFGLQKEVPLATLASAFQTYLSVSPNQVPSTQSLLRLLRYAIGANIDTFVGCGHVETFCRRFGPLEIAVSKARTSLFDESGCLVPWFHGNLSREEAEALLAGKPAGSFLFRYSSRPYNISVSYIEAAASPTGANGAHHANGGAATVLRNSLLYNAGREGFGLARSGSGRVDSGDSASGAAGGAKQGNGASATRSAADAAAAATWPDLRAFVASFAKRLSKPVPSELYVRCKQELEARPNQAPGSPERAAAAALLAREPSSPGPLPPPLPPPPQPPPPSRDDRGGVPLTYWPESAVVLPVPRRQSELLSDAALQKLRQARELYGKAQMLALGDDSPPLPRLENGASVSIVMPEPPCFAANPSVLADAAVNGGNAAENGGSAGSQQAGNSSSSSNGNSSGIAEALELLTQVFSILAEPEATDHRLKAKALRLRGDLELERSDFQAAADSFAACLTAGAAALQAQEADDDLLFATQAGASATAPVGPSAATLGVVQVQAHAHRQLARMALKRGDVDAALEHFSGQIECTTDATSRRDVLQAWRAKPAFVDAIAGWTEKTCAQILESGIEKFRAGQFDAAAGVFQRALLMARCLGATRLEARALGNLAAANKKASRLGEAVMQYRTSLQLMRQLRDLEKEKAILNNLVVSCMEARRWAQAWHYNHQLLQIAYSGAAVEMLKRRRDQIAAAAGWQQAAGAGGAGAAAYAPPARSNPISPAG